MANGTPGNEFEKASGAPGGGLLRECWDLLRYNKKWWLVPLLTVLLLVGLLVVLSGTAIAPFIYTIF